MDDKDRKLLPLPPLLLTSPAIATEAVGLCCRPLLIAYREFHGSPTTLTVPSYCAKRFTLETIACRDLRGLVVDRDSQIVLTI